jgi:ferric-chelate reductase
VVHSVIRWVLPAVHPSRLGFCLLTKIAAGHIDWVAPMLMDIATVVAGCPSLDLHVSIFVTCLCDPEAVPPIPNSVVTMERPSAHQLLNYMITPPADGVVDGLEWAGLRGGLGVCASGPSELTREVANAVAKLSLSRGAGEAGGVGLHTETFVL